MSGEGADPEISVNPREARGKRIAFLGEYGGHHSWDDVSGNQATTAVGRGREQRALFQPRRDIFTVSANEVAAGAISSAVRRCEPNFSVISGL